MKNKYNEAGTTVQHDSIYAEGNMGGDYIYIKNLPEEQIRLEVGSSCVKVLEHYVPVEFLTGIIDKAFMDNNGDLNKIIDSFGWNQEFKDSLKKRVKAVESIRDTVVVTCKKCGNTRMMLASDFTRLQELYSGSPEGYPYICSACSEEELWEDD